MAVQATGEWVIVRSVEKLPNIDPEKSAVYKGIAYSVGGDVGIISNGEEIHFSDENAKAIYHTGSSQTIYFIKKEAVIAHDV